MKNIDQKDYCSSYYGDIVNEYGLKYGTSLSFWGNKGCINEIDLLVGFSGILDTGWVEDQKMTKGKLIDGNNCK